MFGFMLALRPNGWRLSCGAEREGSQTEFYYTVLQDSHWIV